MMWYDGDWNWGWLVMGVAMLAFWAVVLWAILTALRGDRSVQSSPSDPAQVLARRFAAGEIDQAEYESRLRALRVNAETGPRP